MSDEDDNSSNEGQEFVPDFEFHGSAIYANLTVNERLTMMARQLECLIELWSDRANEQTAKIIIGRIAYTVGDLYRMNHENKMTFVEATTNNTLKFLMHDTCINTNDLTTDQADVIALSWNELGTKNLLPAILYSKDDNAVLAALIAMNAIYKKGTHTLPDVSHFCTKQPIRMPSTDDIYGLMVQAIYNFVIDVCRENDGVDIRQLTKMEIEHVLDLEVETVPKLLISEFVKPEGMLRQLTITSPMAKFIRVTIDMLEDNIQTNPITGLEVMLYDTFEYAEEHFGSGANYLHRFKRRLDLLPNPDESMKESIETIRRFIQWFSRENRARARAAAKNGRSSPEY